MIDSANVEAVAVRAVRLLNAHLGYLSLALPGARLSVSVEDGAPMGAGARAAGPLAALARRALEAERPLVEPGVGPGALACWAAAAPLRSNGRCVGALAVAGPARPDNEGTRLIESAAELASLAIESAVASADHRRSRELAERLLAAARALSSTMDLRAVLALVLSELQQVVPYNSASVQQLVDDRMRIVAGHGFPVLDEFLGISFDVHDAGNPNSEVYATRAPLVVDDAPARYAGFSAVPHTKAGIRAFLGVPLMIGETLIGMIALDKDEPGFFTPDHAATALAFASHAAIAMENARLYGEAGREVAERRRVERALRDRELRLDQAQRVAHLGDFALDVDSGALECSAEACRALGGACRPRLDYRAFLSGVHPEDRRMVWPAVRALLRGAAYALTHRLVERDGTVRVVDVRAELSFDASGRPDRIVGTIQDITQTRKTEQRLAMLSSAIEQSADQIFVTDTEGRIEWVNPAFESQTGFTREDAVGQTPRLLKSGRLPDEFYERLWTSIRRGDAYRGEFPNRRKDGSLFHEEKTITPIRDAAGRISHFVSVGRDISERRAAQEMEASLRGALERAAREWRATFDAVDLPIVVLDVEDRVARVNRAAQALLGQPYDAITGKPLPTDREPWKAMARAVSEARAARRSVSGHVERTAAGRNWEVGASPVSDALMEGAAIALARDATPLVELQESLRRHETLLAMGRLVSGVAHEVRNPLFGISATLDAFELDFRDHPAFSQYGSLLKQHIERLSALTQDLAEYAGPAPRRRVPASLYDVLAQAIRSCVFQARAAGASIDLDAPGDLPELDLDRIGLVQAFQSLLENAIQHSPRGGRVTVSARLAAGAGIECLVEDEGPGFREEDLARVFEPFFTRRQGSTGLGLSIVERIVQAHGGSVQAANRSRGGARVTVELPWAGPHGPAGGGQDRQ